MYVDKQGTKALWKELPLHIPILGIWSEFEKKKAIWVTKQLYKQKNKNGDNWLLEKLFVLFIQIKIESYM